MKKICLLPILGAFTSTMLYASTPTTFQKTYGTKYDDVARSVISTDNGYMIIGQSEHKRGKKADMYLINIDKSGKKIWSRSIGGRDDEDGRAIIKTPNGYIAVGTTESYGGGRSSIYAVNLTKNGKMRWHRTFYSDDDSYYYGTGIVKTDGGYKIAGWEHQMEFFNADMYGYIVDINKKGQRTKMKRYGTKDDEKIHDILKIDGGYLLAGETNAVDDEGFNAYLVKIDEKGKKLWQKSYGWKYDERINSIIEVDGGYLLVGTTESNRDKQSEIYVLKVNKSGRTIWQKTYGGSDDEEGYDVVADSDGYVIAGKTETNAKGRGDGYILKIDKKGKVLWDKTYGGDSVDALYGITKSSDGGYIVVGETASYGRGRSDAYIIKVNRDGDLIRR